MASYKEEHEKFVSGHNGTTVTEVAYMTLTPCAGVLLRNALLLVYGLHRLPFWCVIPSCLKCMLDILDQI